MAKPLSTYTKNLSEILKGINGLKTKQDRIAALAANTETALNDLLVLAFNEHVNILLPDTIPPYTPGDKDHHPSNLRQEARKFHFLIDEPGHGMLKPMKRQQIYLNILEGIHPDDADLLAKAVAKQWPYKRLGKDVVEAAKPGIFAAPAYKK